MPIAQASGEISVRVKLQQSDTVEGPKLEVEGHLAALHILLSPQQLQMLVEMATGIASHGTCVCVCGVCVHVMCVCTCMCVCVCVYIRIHIVHTHCGNYFSFSCANRFINKHRQIWRYSHIKYVLQEYQSL